MTDTNQLPHVGSVWLHTNGIRYIVLHIANEHTERPDQYPVTVVYQGYNGRIWSRAASDWHRSMTLAEPIDAQLAQGEPVTDEQIDRITVETFGWDADINWHRPYARAILALRPAAQEVDERAGWTDADADAARLALELECLLLDTKDTASVSRWWASANEALDLHRARLAAPQQATPDHAAEVARLKAVIDELERREIRSVAQQATQAKAPHPLAACCYTMSEPHLSGYRLLLGFETLEAVDAAQTWVANLRKGTQQATPEPVGEPTEGEFFAFDPEGGHAFYKTRQEASNHAKESLKYYRDGANAYGEWDEGVEHIRWGVVMQRTKATNISATEDGENLCDYELQDVATRPAHAAQAVPMTMAQVDAAWDGLMPSGCGKSRYDITRLIEAHHGITAHQQQPFGDGFWIVHRKKGTDKVWPITEAQAVQIAAHQQQAGGEVVAYRETITGRICEPNDTHRLKFPMCYEPLVLGNQSSVKKTCATCEALRKDFARECVDTDVLLRLLGLDPAQVRTDGGSLKLQQLADLIEQIKRK